MFCRHCGKELADDAFMCPSCGSPTGVAPIKQEPVKETEKSENSPHHTGLSAVAFILSLIALVTGVIFGAFFFVYENSALLLYILGASTILPALAGISIGAYLLCVRSKLSSGAKAFAIVSIVLSAVVILFLFIGGCVIVTKEYYYFPIDYTPIDYTPILH